MTAELPGTPTEGTSPSTTARTPSDDTGRTGPGSAGWLSRELRQRRTFVIGGFTERVDSAAAVGSLLLGQYDASGRLLPAGRVGSGFDSATAIELHRRLLALRATHSPFAEHREGRRTPLSSAPHWVRPKLVADVSFSGWTADGSVRHAVFHGLRRDTPPRRVRRDDVAAPAADAGLGGSQGSGRAGAAAPDTHDARDDRTHGDGHGGRGSDGDDDRHGRPGAADRGDIDDDEVEVAGIRITHASRVIDAGSGLRKIDLVRYYEALAPLLLPHLKGRPIALLRAPEGLEGERFFQKHPGGLRIPGLRVLDPQLWPGREPLIEIGSLEALVGAAQMNMIELHGWNAASRRVDLPNRMVFDLDPGEGVAWPLVQDAAREVRALLDQLGLRSWLKTSGSKGLHVVVPIAARWPAEVVKAFSRSLVLQLVQRRPERFVATPGASHRVGRIFVDYLRNGLGATTVVAFSARARPGLGVSMTLSWEQLDTLTGSAQWTVADALQHLQRRREDPWAGFFATRQGLSGAMRRIAFDVAEPAQA